MQIVIDIPDDDYMVLEKWFRLENLNGTLEQRLFCAVANGTVLPKGHGDLIDRSKLDTRERGNNSQRCMWRNIKQIIENTPIVVESDKEKVDENS